MLPVSLCPEMAWTAPDHDAFIGFARSSLPCVSVKTLLISQTHGDVRVRGPSLGATSA